ncbi:MAG: hypothetical protein ACI9JY_002613, partial [Saprospiraceae bacterium]
KIKINININILTIQNVPTPSGLSFKNSPLVKTSSSFFKTTTVNTLNINQHIDQ